MKKLLIGAAVAGLAIGLSAQANAQVKLNLGGHFKGYGAYVSQDNRSAQRAMSNVAPATDAGVQAALTAASERHVDILRETEIHFTGETTLDNGLTVGFHAEADIDQPDSFTTEEAYAYFSGAWGRVNFGKEDGAAYLLQIAAPSADSNVDGIRQNIQAVNYDFIGNHGRSARVGDSAQQFAARGGNLALQDLFGTGLNDGVNGAGLLNDSVLRYAGATLVNTNGDIRVGAAGVGLTASRDFGYDQAVSGYANKLTYLTPVFSGFQAGVSYTPEIGVGSRGSNGVAQKDANTFGDAWDVALRYEGQFGELGMAVGAGFTHAERHTSVTAPVFYRDNNGNGTFQAGTDTVLATLDDRQAWNVGLDLNWGPFGIGAVYTEDDRGVSSGFGQDTWVVGIDYTTGPFKVGASYLNREQEFGPAELDTDRWTAGVTYTYGPGMTFRGSVSYIDHDAKVGFQKTSADATSFLLGTQIDF